MLQDYLVTFECVPVLHAFPSRVRGKQQLESRNIVMGLPVCVTELPDYLCCTITWLPWSVYSICVALAGVIELGKKTQAAEPL